VAAVLQVEAVVAAVAAAGKPFINVHPLRHGGVVHPDNEFSPENLPIFGSLCILDPLCQRRFLLDRHKVPKYFSPR
jgi:hypothetical protein